MRKIFSILLLLTVFLLNGCNKDIPEPESENKFKAVPVSDPVLYTSETNWSLQH